jgi:hypothetical protein
LIGVSACVAVIVLAAAAPVGAGTKEPSSDRVTPLLVTSLSEPIPVKGTDDKIHVAYELSVFNASPRPAVLERIDTIAGRDEEVVASIDADKITARLVPLGPLLLNPEASNDLAPGETAAVLLDDVYDSRAAVPDTFSHRFVASFGPPPAGSHPIASVYPSSLDAVIGETTLGPGAPAPDRPAAGG